MDECLFKIGSNIFSIDAFEISLDGNKEICLTIKNTTSEKCALKPDIMEMKSLLSQMKNEITKMNTEIYQIKEQLKKTEVCARRTEGKVNITVTYHLLIQRAYALKTQFFWKTQIPLKV